VLPIEPLPQRAFKPRSHFPLQKIDNFIRIILLAGCKNYNLVDFRDEPKEAYAARPQFDADDFWDPIWHFDIKNCVEVNSFSFLVKKKGMNSLL
jgi:hypothetical protein